MPKTKPAKDAPEWAAKLTPRERVFVEQYLVDLNATEAALRAGYGRGIHRNVAKVKALELRRKLHVAEAISTLISERYGASQARVFEELAKLAFYDIGEAVTVENGAVVVRDFKDLDPDVRAAVVSVEERVNERGHRSIICKLADKNQALKTLAAVLNMRRSPTSAAPGVQVNVQVNNTAENASARIQARLDAVMARNAQAALPAPTQAPMPMVVDAEFQVVEPVLVESK
jgi:phage terminase small subunit